MYINHLEDFPLEIVHNVMARQILFWEGQDCDHVFDLYSGIVRGVTISDDGDRQVTGFFFAGDQIGLPLNSAYRYSAEAITNVSFVKHQCSNWRAALGESCRNDGHMLRAIGLEQDSLYCRSTLLGRQGAVARVAAFLHSIVDRLPRNKNGFDLPIPQLDIADYLALSPETVCRALKRLQELNVIAMPGHDQLIIEDISDLERASRSMTAHKS